MTATHLIAQSQNRLEEQSAECAFDAPSQITTNDYGDFLNERAGNDRNHFYDWKMGVDVLESASILRSGAPGSWRYEVITGKEKMPMTFLSYNDAVEYCAWKNSAASTFNLNCCVGSCDSDLKSNILTFSLLNSTAASHQASETAAVAGTELDAILEEAVGVIGLGVAGAESARASEIEPAEGADRNIANQSRHLDERNQESTLRSAQREQIVQGLARLTLREEMSTALHYQAADHSWDQLQTSWEAQSTAQQQLLQSRMQLTLAQENLKKAQEASADEARKESRLGKASDRAVKIANVLHLIPEVHLQLAATGLNTVAQGIDWINTIWTTADVLQAKGTCDQVNQASQIAAKRSAEANKAVNERTTAAQEKEKQAIESEKQVTHLLANSIKPPELEAAWNEGARYAWVEQIPLDDIAHTSALVEFLKSNFLLLHEKVATSWQNRIAQAEEEEMRLRNRKKIILAPLFEQYQKTSKEVETAAKAVQKTFEERGIAQTESTRLKNALEELVGKLPDVANNYDLLAKTRNNFCKTFCDFYEIQQGVEAAESLWQKALETESKKQKSAFAAAKKYHEEKEKQLRLLNRATARLQSDQVIWRRIWPEKNLNSHQLYHLWPLPAMAHEEDVKQESEQINEHALLLHEIAPPEKLLSEIEKQGRRYFESAQLQIQKAIDQIKNSPTKTASTATQATEMFAEAARESVPELASEFLEKEALLEQLKKWSIAQLEYPSSEDELRWAARAKADQIEAERLRKGMIWRQRQQKIGEDQLIADDKSEQTPSHAQRGFVFNFGAKSLFSANSRTACSTASNGIFLSLTQDEAWRHLENLEEEKAATELMWEQQLAEAANHFGNNEGSLNDWKEADRAAIAERTRRAKKRNEEKIAAELEKSWESSTARWKARAEADRYYKILESVKADFATINPKYPEIIEAKRKWETAEAAWKERAGTEETPFLKKWDQAVNRCWERTIERNQKYPDPETRERLELENEECTNPDSTAYFRELLAKQRNEIKNILQSIQPAEALAAYQETTQEEALRAATENIPGAEKAWQRRAEFSALNKNQNETHKAIADADQRALKIFQKSHKRLRKIENLWQGILDANQEREAAQKKARNWYELSFEERSAYNTEVIQQNNKYKEEQEAARNAIEKAKAEVERTQLRTQGRGYWTSFEQRSLEFEHAQKNLKKLQDAYEERTTILRWETMTPAERENYILQKKIDEEGWHRHPQVQVIKKFYQQEKRSLEWFVRDTDEFLTGLQKGWSINLLYHVDCDRWIAIAKHLSYPLSENVVIATIHADIFDAITVRCFGAWLLNGHPSGQSKFKEHKKESCFHYQEISKLHQNYFQNRILTMVLAEERAWAIQIREESYRWFQDDRWNTLFKKERLMLESMVTFLNIGPHENQSVVVDDTRQKRATLLQEAIARQTAWAYQAAAEEDSKGNAQAAESKLKLTP